ncbi:MAG: DNA alkylation repair protein [Clostridiales bacterium]|nr:DNA alkylation repair protein [Clostridiales bacterium]
MDLRQQLFAKRDLKYREFHKKLIPNIDENKIIGVRVPELRKIAKRLNGNDFAWDYYEEKMLHGFYIGYSDESYEKKLAMLDDFVPKIDNWAVCDCAVASFKFISQNQKSFLKYLQKYIESDREYELRFAAVILMDYYLTDTYIDYCLDFYLNAKSEHYYVKMAVAWGLSKAFAEYEDRVLTMLQRHLLDKDTERMTIGKINDSYRVSADAKQRLKSIK